MKNSSLIFIAFLFLQFTAYAQDGWHQQTSNTAFNLRSLYFVNENIGWIVGADWDSKNGVLLKTTNGGSNWITEIIDSVQLRSVHFINEETGWIAGGNHGTLFNSCISYKTTNSGQNWDSTHISDIYPMPSQIFFSNKDIGYMARSWYFPYHTSWFCLLKTTDGGENWFGLNIPPQKFCPISSIHFIDDTGWFTTSHNLSWGGGGIIYKTTDAGNSWQFQFEMQRPYGRPGRLHLSLHFINSNVGWAVGGGSWGDTLSGDTGLYRTIFKTTNGGTNWNIQLQDSIIGSGTSYDYILLDVQFTDSSNGWAVGEGGYILHTTNGGLNWIDQESGLTETLSSVFFVDRNNGWAVGDGGVILHTTNGGVSFVEEGEIDEIPTEFLLSNNYPNPFNPSTKIKYSVPQTSKVIIKIYDVLGNEIETLINEEKPIGTYEITWYAEELPSGVYFYQLKTERFVETKKMILIK